ncbi:MAG: T9SS type A sorting domain-containing protein [Bacteroidetes bacterium]|nr:T9SS type A sorting domain-containing protein [Bacteroidota bacterium]
MKLRLPLLMGVLMLPVLMYSQVIINEFSAANMNTILDNYGDEEDWIELYNTGASPVDLSGYHLSDKLDDPMKWEIPAGYVINPGEYRLVFASKRDELSGGFLHADFKLTQTTGNDAVVLADALGNILDSYEILIPNQTDHAWGRVTDGSDTWGVMVNPSPGGPNGGSFSAYAGGAAMSLDPGFYSGGQTVTLATTEPDSEIRYTTNGSDPSPTSALYTGPISINSTTVLRARVYSNNPTVLPGLIETNTYFIDVAHTVPVISIAGDDILTLLNGSQIEPIASFEYYEEDGSFIDEAVGEFNKHGNDSWAYQQRGIDYITRDQFGYNDDIDHEIFSNKERNDYQRLIIKAAANDNYPFEQGAHIRDAYVHELSQRAEMELDERSYEPAILYVNGEYWGVYESREKVDDHDYTKEYYDQGKEWIDFIKTWGGTWEEYGSWDDWYDLHDFVLNNDMSDPANYDYVTSQFNVLSLIDYMILNTHVVCMDWLNWNTAWWRGRKPTGGAQTWRYALWDLDATFGHYVNYTGVPDTTPNADPCDNEEYTSDFEGHVDLVVALMENEDFHQLYVNRYADMNNSFFNCDYMIDLLDELIDRIQPEMQGQIDRWGGTMAGWEAQVQELKDFILDRCVEIDGGIVDCYDVEGPYPVQFNVVPENSGNAIKINTFIPTAFPFMGDYFGGIDIELTAVPLEPEYEFSHWEVNTNAYGPDEYAEVIEIAMETGDEITAYFNPSIPCAQPANVEIDSSAYSLEVSWTGPFNNLSYEVKYRILDSGDDWTILTNVGNNFSAFGLEECTDYEFTIRAICQQATSDPYEFIATTSCLTTSSVSEPIAITEFSAFPNPFRDDLFVDLQLDRSDRVELRVTDLSGRILSRNQLDLPAGQHQIPVATGTNWASGLYMIQLLTKDGVLTKQVVKM